MSLFFSDYHFICKSNFLYAICHSKWDVFGAVDSPMIIRLLSIFNSSYNRQALRHVTMIFDTGLADIEWRVPFPFGEHPQNRIPCFDLSIICGVLNGFQSLVNCSMRLARSRTCPLGKSAYAPISKHIIASNLSILMFEPILSAEFV